MTDVYLKTDWKQGLGVLIVVVCLVVGYLVITNAS